MNEKMLKDLRIIYAIGTIVMNSVPSFFLKFLKHLNIFYRFAILIGSTYLSIKLLQVTFITGTGRNKIYLLCVSFIDSTYIMFFVKKMPRCEQI